MDLDSIFCPFMTGVRFGASHKACNLQLARRRRARNGNVLHAMPVLMAHQDTVARNSVPHTRFVRLARFQRRRPFQAKR